MRTGVSETGGRYHADAATIARRIDQIAHQRRVTAYLRTRITTDEVTGKPALTRYSDVKGPLAVAPMFLHNNRRIAALITVICLALLVFCLVERHVRRALAPATDLAGFYAYDNRALRPTGRLIFTALSRIHLRTARDDQPPLLLIPDPIQKRLLQLLKIDPTRPRWLTE